MSREVEALQSWLEVRTSLPPYMLSPIPFHPHHANPTPPHSQSLIFQLHSLNPQEAEFLLAGITAQIKAHAGIVLQHVVADAIQIMGGIGLTKGGRGERVERIWRDVKALTVPGGSEEVMLDLAVRRAVKAHEELVKMGGEKKSRL